MKRRTGALTAAMVDKMLPIDGGTIEQHQSAHLALADKIKRDEAVGGTDNE